ncbi:MAG: Rv3654c family TadE-like protein [Candidatus Nanopelagicales bacterium]
MSPREDRGAGTLLTFMMFPMLFIALALVWAFVDMSTVRQRAAGAADLAALAGAPHVLLAPDFACQRAGEIAQANRANLEECSVEALDIEVTVSVASTGISSRLASWLGLSLPPVRQSARAGPG